MKKDVAVLADIHGNHVALEACLNHCREKGVETYIFLGDYIGEFAYPERTMEQIYAVADRYECHFVRGNKEEYQLDYRANGGGGWRDSDSTTGCLLYCHKKLTEWDFGFFEQLPIAAEVEFAGFPKLMVCHGSPERVDEKMKPRDERTCEVMERCDADIILCGHTHVQGRFFHGKKVFINPGAVGLPLRSSAKCQFLLLHAGRGGWRGEFVNLDYDTERVLAELREERLEWHAPFWTKVTEYLLRQRETSDISHGRVLERAMELCEAAEGSCVWPKVPEKYWEQAFLELTKI